ncbi:MAG TPA: NUDIX domain-containing protein [Thermoplasmata archaeon]|nr:NUDIX domain-containing protein [Thermoplasmata archaeon]
MNAHEPSAPGDTGEARIDRLLAPWSRPGPPATAAGAAVVLVLRGAGDAVETLLLERAIRAQDPASGQIGLPGGHVDPADGTLEATALRELEEEVGLPGRALRRPVRFVAVEDAPRFGLTVGVFAAALDGEGGPAFRPDPREVASLFWLPDRALETVGTVVRETPLGPRAVEGVTFDRHIVWGFTLKVLRRFFAGNGPRGSGPSSPNGSGQGTP